MAGGVDIPSADSSMAGIKYLDTQFSALEFNSVGDNYDSTTAASDQSGVAALSNKFGQSVSSTPTPQPDLTTMNTFQATQSKQSHPSTNMSSVLNQNNKVCIVHNRTSFVRQNEANEGELNVASSWIVRSGYKNMSHVFQRLQPEKFFNISFVRITSRNFVFQITRLILWNLQIFASF